MTDNDIPDTAPPEDEPPRSRWDKAKPQIVAVLRRVADALNRIADEL